MESILRIATNSLFLAVNSTLAKAWLLPLRTSPLFEFLICEPNNANVIPSIILDFPAPFAPTKTVTPLPNSNFVLLCERKFASSTDCNIFQNLLYAIEIFTDKMIGFLSISFS